MEKINPLASLPKIDKLLDDPALSLLVETSRVSRARLLRAARQVLDTLRGDLKEALTQNRQPGAPDYEAVKKLVETKALDLAKPSLKRLINATGVVIHTNLGRSPLPQSALSAAFENCGGYSNLEYNLTTGQRGSRHSHVEKLITDLTGAEAALVVNNNAAAVYLCLKALAEGREAVVSRGELVEIGGSFRVPDLMTLSGCTLVEAGTTNKTKLADYESAATAQTALFLKILPSNFKIIGFTECPNQAELAGLAKAKGIISLCDQGCGLLFKVPGLDLKNEPAVTELLADGFDLVTFSGDKLLGGPQAGIIAGRADLIALLKKHQLIRALRPDKVTLALLEATLRLYETPQQLTSTVPTVKALAQPKEELKRLADNLARRLRPIVAPHFTAAVKEATAEAGGGALAGEFFNGYAVALKPLADFTEAWLEERLRLSDPPVITRLAEGCLWLDPRTLLPKEINTVVSVFKNIFQEKY